jgi:hypothetical protein
LLSLSPLSTISSDLSTDASGLSAPAATITITTANKSFKLVVGNLTATSSGYYCQFDGNKTIVLDKYALDDVLSAFTTENLTAPTPTSIPLTVEPTTIVTGTPTAENTSTAAATTAPADSATTTTESSTQASPSLTETLQPQVTPTK